MDKIAFIRDAVKLVPQVKPLLSNAARYYIAANGREYKTQEYFVQQIRGLVRSLYANQIGGEFIDTMANLISGQLYDAYTRAWNDEEEVGPFPDYLFNAWQDDTVKQYGFVDQYFRDIIDARIDGTPIDPLLYRADLWANRWTESYNNAIKLITEANGGNMIWIIGDAEHCDTCLALNGKIASAKDWEISGWMPQSQELDCHGYNCKCSLIRTDKRKSPKVLDFLLGLRLKLD